MNSLKRNKCNLLKSDSVLENLSTSIIKKRRSLCQRKSLKLLKDAKVKLQKAALNARFEYIGDRIMAHRAYMDYSQSEDILICRANRENMDFTDDLSVSNLIDRTIMPGNGRLLKLTSRHKSPTYEHKLKELYEKNTFSGTSKCSRHISVYPERILDAPMLSNTYWNILDWNRKGLLAVALGNAIYLWNYFGGNVEELVKNNTTEEFTCVKWLDNYDDNILAVGSADGKVTLWKGRRHFQSIDTQNLSKITVLTIKKTIFSIGFASGIIQHYDLKNKATLFANNEYHKQTIYRMKWSTNYVYLAVASKDGSVSVWTANRLHSSPIAHFQENNKGVYDIAWSPRQESHILYAGGDNNNVLKIMDVKTRVCVRSLIGSEMMSSVWWSHSFTEVAVTVHEEGGNCRVRVYSESSLRLVIEMTGHRGDIITLTSNPANGLLATIGRDESIRLWSCFKNEGNKKSRDKTVSVLDGPDRLR